ncbi:MAG TPA: hypothetical protein PLS69_14245 [Terricaulis sp.]|nr:hypothetical protein [Terricaulis sp.]HRP10169.1 hypothetical protein [Terricaulis sp.]
MTTISIIALAIGVGFFFALAAVSIATSRRVRNKRRSDGGAMSPLGEDFDI